MHAFGYPLAGKQIEGYHVTQSDQVEDLVIGKALRDLKNGQLEALSESPASHHCASFFRSLFLLFTHKISRADQRHGQLAQPNRLVANTLAIPPSQVC